MLKGQTQTSAVDVTEGGTGTGLLNRVKMAANTKAISNTGQNEAIAEAILGMKRHTLVQHMRKN